MKAMIFAAGFGTRLRPITKTVPKALVSVKNRPMLHWIIDQLIQSGFDEIIINTHYRHKQIKSFIESLDLQTAVITLSYEKKILGTGGGLLKTKDFWGDGDCYVCNGDILCDINIRDFLQNHHVDEYPITLAVNDNPSASMLLVDERGEFCGRQIKEEQILYYPPKGKVTAKGFAGIHLIHSAFIRRQHTNTRFSIIDQYVDFIKEGRRISTYPIKDVYWSDIGTLNSLQEANREFKGFTDYSPS